MAIQYRTRGQSNPHGKPRVYFSCYPADYQAYFQSVADEILELNNCAIYYEEEAVSGRDSDYLLNLSQMQLLVIPVSAYLLSKPCRTIDVDLPFALEHHIPILPLMQEPGLDQLFSRKFGALQYLDKTSRDTSAISYRTKLKNFLDAVLVGDTMGSKIRAAFSSYIFLSYRKKDRKYAQELMRLIHANEFCRDVAIWYDEFLVPGENWSDSILQAMRKSQVFALTVTPNLVNEENYVMTTEYPMAQRTNMPIVAAEMLPTSHEQLCQLYRDYPGSVDARNPEALSRALSAHYSDCSHASRNDPAHLFYIGLAYLSGVDVEIDHERAVALITAAANAGHTDAMEKLAAMYRNGDGVSPNRDLECFWLKKLVRQARHALFRKPSWETGIQLSTRLKNLGNILLESARLNEAKAAFRRSIFILTIIKKVSRRCNRDLLHMELSDSYERLSAVYRAEGKTKEARELIFKASLAAPLVSSDSSPAQAILSKAASTMRLAESWLYDMDGAEYAEKHYMEALELLELLVRRGDSDSDVQGCLAQGYTGLGEICTGKQQYDQAREWYEKALALQEQRTAERNTPQARLELAIVYRKLGSALLAAGATEDCLSRYLDAWKILQKLADDLGFSSAIHELVVTCNLLAEISTPDQSEKWIVLGLDWSSRLYQETNTGSARRDLASMLMKAGSLDLDRGRLDPARDKLQKALHLAQELAGQTNEVPDQILLLEIQLLMADLSMARGDIKKAKKQYHRILSANEQLSNKTYSVNTERIDLLGSKKLGEIYLLMGYEENLENLLNADIHFGDAAASISFVPATPDMLRTIHGLACSYRTLAEQFLAANATTDLPLDVDASSCYEEAYRLLLWLYSKTRNPEYLPEMRELCFSLSRLYQEAADLYNDDDAPENAIFWKKKAQAVDDLPETDTIDVDEEYP